MATATTPLPNGIEIFRAGRHVDDAGNVYEFSGADVAAIAASYDPALREAPLTVGHPAHNLPAYGWVKGLGENGGVLTMNPHQVEPQFAEMVHAGRFKKRSASFYPPDHPGNPKPGAWYLRHVAFLGAQPPAVAGLKDFAEADAAGAVSFSEVVPVPPGQQGHVLSHPSLTNHQERTMPTEEELAAAKKKADEAEAAKAAAEAEAAAAKAKLAQFAEQQRQDRHTAHVSFAEAHVQAGKLLPKDKETAVAVLDALADSQPVEFSEAGATKKVSPAEFVKSLIAGANPAVSFGEFAPGSAGQGGKDRTDAEIDRDARAYAAKHSVSYSEALTKVTSFTA